MKTVEAMPPGCWRAWSAMAWSSVSPTRRTGAEACFSLTRRARLRLPKAKAALIQGEQEVIAGFSATEKELLLTLLQRVVSNLETQS